MSFPKKGKSFPRKSSSELAVDDRAFAMKISSALKLELNDQNSSAKLVAGWTGANERTAKNWILGRYVPCGRHLVMLAQHSDKVLNAILTMAGRENLLLTQEIEDFKQKVFELAEALAKPGP